MQLTPSSSLNVVDLNGFSGHADREDLRDFFRPLREHRPRVCLVHGDMEQAVSLAGTLKNDGFASVSVPKRGDSVLVGRDGTTVA